MMQSTKKQGQNEDSETRKILFSKLKIFWFVTEFSDIFTVRA